jgi:hypothetical protein
MNENVITSSFIMRGMIPMVIDNDREALQVALRCTWGVEAAQARIVRIPNTLHLKYAYVSEVLVPEIKQAAHIEIISEPEHLQFDDNGYLPQMAEDHN